MGEGGCFDFVCVLGFGVVLVGALGFGLCFGLLYWFWYVALFRDNCIGLLGGALCFEGFKG